MAKLKLNSALVEIRGSIDGYVLKKTPHGPVLARKPDMAGVKWSPAQKAQRKRMRAAARHYRKVMEDPMQAARLRAEAARKRMPVSSFVMAEYLQGLPK